MEIATRNHFGSFLFSQFSPESGSDIIEFTWIN